MEEAKELLKEAKSVASAIDDYGTTVSGRMDPASGEGKQRRLAMGRERNERCERD